MTLTYTCLAWFDAGRFVSRIHSTIPLRAHACRRFVIVTDRISVPVYIINLDAPYDT